MKQITELGLTPETLVKAQQVVKLCTERGVEMLVYCGLRTCKEQAQLFVNGMTQEKAKLKIDYLRYDLNLEALADILETANIADEDKDDGAPATKAAPGESLHNYGMAFDAVPLILGKPAWDDAHPAWQIYGQAVKDSGMFWAGDWTRFREYPHAQMIEATNALRAWRPGEIMQRLRAAGSLT